MSLEKFRRFISLLLSITVLLTNTVWPSVVFAQEEAIATESADLVANEPLMPESTASAETTDGTNPEPTQSSEITPPPTETPDLHQDPNEPSDLKEASVKDSNVGLSQREKSASLDRSKMEGIFSEEGRKQDKDYVEGEVIVKFKEERIDVKRMLGKVQAYVFEKKFSLEKIDEIKSSNIQVFKSKKSTEEMVKELKSDPNVEYAEPNYISPWSSTVPNDTNFSLQWGLNNTTTPTADVSAPEAWDITTGSGSVVVGILDSGIAYNHPDLVNNMWDGSSGCKDQNNSDTSCPNHGWDFVTPDNDPIDDNGHGTHVAGVIGAEGNNSKGIAGINWNVKLMALKVGDHSGAITSDWVQAIDFAINNNIKVLNASFGGTHPHSNAQYDAINRFKAAGGIFVAAAGNGGSDQIGDDNENAHFYPSDYDLDNIISVAATDQNDNLASFSNYGSASVDVGAPGTSIYSTEPERVFDEDFESVSVPAIGDNFTQSGDDTWGTKSNVSDTNKALFGDYANWGQYQNDKYSALESQVVNLSGKEESYLNFDLFCDTELGYDGIILYFFDGATWVRIDDYSGYIDYETFEFLLQNYANENFQVAFGWITDESVNNYQGCYIDNIKINDGASSSEQYQYMRGTSMAAPYVAGLAGLIWSYQPGLTYSQVKNAILSTGDSIPDLHPTTGTHPISSGRRINAYNALSSIETPTITSLSDDTTPRKSKTWDWGSDDAAAQFRYLIDQEANSVPAGEYGNIKTATQPDGDGVYYIHVQAKSGTGVESSVTTVSAILDNTPSTMEITSPLTGSKVNGDAVVAFTSSELVTPQCSINNSDWIGCASGVTTLSDMTGFGSLPEGVFTLYVTGADIAGNIGSDTEAGIIKDTTVPTGSITSPTNDTYSNVLPLFTASASDANGIDSVSFQYKPSSASVHTDLNTDMSAPYEGDWTDESLTTNTTYDLQIIITDMAGNFTAVGGVSFTYDTTLPTGLVIINNNDIYTNTRNVTLSFPDVSSDVVKMRLGNGESGGYQSPIDYENPHSYTLPDNGDGSYFVRVRFIDRAGNESSGVIKDDIILDSTPPATTDSTDSQWHNANITIKLDCDDGEGSGCAVTYYTTDGSTPNTGSSSGNSIALTTDGIYTIKYFSKDNMGNTESVKTAANTVKMDKTPPEDPNITSSHTVSTWSNDNTIDLSWDEPLDNISGIAGYSYLWDTVATTLPDTVSEGADTFVNSTTLVDGNSHYFHLRTVDNAGNWTSTVHLGPFFIDTVDPEITTYTLDNPTISPEVSSGIKDTVTINLAFSEYVDYWISIKNGEGTVVRYWSGTATNPDAEVWDGKNIGGSCVADGTYTLEITITDDADNSITDTSKTIIVDNDPLTLNPVGDKSIDEGEELTFSATASNDEGDPVSFSLTDAPAGASIDSSSGVFSWTPTEVQGPGSYVLNVNATSGDLFEYEEITITVNEVNTDPVANAQSVSTKEDTDLKITLTADDSDIPENILNYSIVSPPSHGTVSLSGNKATYTPGSNYNGVDSFTFKVNDGTADSTPAAVSITVNPVNDYPTAVSDAASVKEDETLTIAKLDLLSNDSDVDGDLLTLTDVSNPVHGSVAIDGDNVTFTPDTDYFGPASFDYTISDGSLTDTATVTVTVNPVNDAPSITLISPNGGQIFAGGSQQEISWVASDVDVGDTLVINLEYLVGTDEPAPIASLLTNSGSYSWVVPEIDSSSVKIVATVFDGAIFASDLSDADFIVDSTPPDGLLLFSSSHAVSTWSNDNTVEVGWAGAIDITSGVDGYYTEWNNLDSDLTGTLTKEYEVSVTSEISQSLLDGKSHYFHIAAVDKAGNWSTVVNLGPFWIDVTPPSAIFASPASGVYEAAQNVALSSSDSISIRYSTSGIINNCDDGVAYSDPITIATSSTIFAIACDAAGNKRTGSFNFVISSTDLTPPSGSQGQASLGSNLILTNDTVLDLVNGIDAASGGNIVIGGVSQPLNDFTSGDLNGEDLSTTQNIGGQTILVEKAVKLDSTSDILLTNNDLSDVSVSIPNNTTVLASSDWNGQISPPKEGSGDGNAPSGFSVGDTVIEVGAPGMVLLFDKAVTILLAGVTGSVGYRAGGSDDWVEISNQCGGSYDAPDSPTFPGECYISDGENTKILTYHFTSFAKLDKVSSDTNPAPTSTSSSASDSDSASEDSSLEDSSDQSPADESPAISQGEETISVTPEGPSENVLGVKATDEIVQDSEEVQVNKQKETDGKPKLEVLGVEKPDRFPAYLIGLVMVLAVIGFLSLKRFRGGVGGDGFFNRINSFLPKPPRRRG